MRPTLTFRGFLELQADRDDVVGDMARAHARCRFTDYGSFVRHLALDGDASGADLAAARSVWRQWRSYARRRGVSA